MHWNKPTKRTLAGFVAIIAFLLLPWQHDIRAPAVMGARDAQNLYAVAAARVVKPPVAVGARVQAGDVLVQLASPDLTFQLNQARIREQLLHKMLAQQPFNPELRQEGDALQKRWAGAHAETRALEEEADRLIVRAPFAGRVAEANDGLAVGSWVAEREKLFLLEGESGIKGQAFIGEADLKRLQGLGHEATFIADTPEYHPITCHAGQIDRVNVNNLDTLSLASIYGGPIAVQRDRSDGALVPTETLFRVRLEKCGDGPAPSHEIRGVIHLSGSGSGVLGKRLRHAVMAIQREMGF